LKLTYLGHATILIEMDGVRIVTDPIFRQRVAHLNHRHTPLVPKIDAVVISHLHFDHMDLPSLRMLPPATRLIVPRGAARLLRRFHAVEELGVGETTTVGAVTIKATFALHARERYRFGPVADCLSFVISGSRSLYFAGDTALFADMAELAAHLDVALLPVWGWGPTLGHGHMNPREAAEALILLQPRLAIPIHWGSLHPIGLGWFKPRFLFDPPHDFVRHAAQVAPTVKTHIIDPGHTISLADLLSS
jgi:L-ascorbate metabolism protein UlaG (beta-lactamase superfamily)